MAVKCPKCQFDNREGVKFCEKCEAKVREYGGRSAGSTEKERLCGNCGCAVSGNSKICKWCGADLKQEGWSPPPFAPDDRRMRKDGS